MTTIYRMPNGQFTDSYQRWKDAEADHAAAQAAFDNRFGAMLSTPEGRRAAVDAFRAGAPQPMTVRIAPAAPKYQGGLSEAEVDRLAEAADTGVTNRHGAEVFPVPSRPPQVVANSLPPGMTRVNFFSGIPQG
ncbi:MAG: hypothetical protein DI563_11030 [Variovorax paradoxus]|uniref:Uncharacterized protein n=1 Tax=Variovorax paradoxus TaxID=34073 RepID=A0A2W5Q9A9_VARPD|nr:MAG: hypothetical protein DI563_11030 [Variovorax paradoxus]